MKGNLLKHIRIRGAATHNLKNIDIDIPRDQLVVITGPSGSGKSSLAFDTIFAEGQRAYVESLSAGARRYISQLPKPVVDSIEGLSPTIAINQSQPTGNPRSTVGTATELYDFLRLLFARAGQPNCPDCHAPIVPRTVQQIVDDVVERIKPKTRFSILSPSIRQQKGDLKGILNRLKRDGYIRVRIDNEMYDLHEPINVNKSKLHDVDITIDRLVMADNIENRLADSLELALKESDGLVLVDIVDGPTLSYTNSFSCAQCGKTTPKLEPTDFSFNTPAGACKTCEGLGVTLFFEESKVIANPALCIREGAIVPWTTRNTPYYQQLLDAVTTQFNIDPFLPWNKLPKKHQQLLLFGTDKEIALSVDQTNRKGSVKKKFEGIIPNLERRRLEYERRKKDKQGTEDYLSDEFRRFMNSSVCESCQGARLKTESLHVTICDQNISQITALPIGQAVDFFSTCTLPPLQTDIAAPIVTEIKSRLQFLHKVGLEYLSLNRTMASLSGGEAQRVRLANQIGSSLVGVTYVLDEPSIGLHQHDHHRLLETLCALRQRGNSVIVVEHDADTMNMADFIIDMGPGAGTTGGQIVAKGTPNELKANPHSLTGHFLGGTKQIPIPKKNRTPRGKPITLKNASTNNLKNITVQFPIGVFTAVTGVSGSGKSSLVMDSLLPAAKATLHPSAKASSQKNESLTGLRGRIDKVISIDQTPIGRTPRSNPATFTGLFADIRELFSQVPESKKRGYKSGRYSFNIKGGRCEACQGDGQIRIEMNFLPDTFITCEICHGNRYNRETLEIQYKGKNIAQILALTCNQAYVFLENHTKIRQKLMAIREVGLGYLQLGQSAATLSGGEAQRLKLAKELSKPSSGNTLYIMDEPTTGLHFEDIRQLLDLLHRLVEAGNSIIVIEHQLDVIKNADWIIDMGPLGGENGGSIVAEGTVQQVANAQSYTGYYLNQILQ